MTEKLYWQDAYIQEFEARVTNITENKLQLDKTAFYPKGGGLVSDLGEINGVKVLEVTKDAQENIFHTVEDVASFSKENTVKCKLDWARRYNVMKMHTAAHLFSAIINKETRALITGNSIEPDISRIDFNLESFDKERFNEYVQNANDRIKEGAEVKSYFLNREEAMKMSGVVKLAQAAPPNLKELRIVEISGIDIQADGGVHVKNISEIGKVKLIKLENKGKNNRRLYYTIE